MNGPPDSVADSSGTSPAAISARMGAADWGLLMLLSVLWGGSFFFVEVAVADLPTFTLVWLRVALAALVLYAGMRVFGLGMALDGRAWRAFLIMGLLNNAIPFTLIVLGQTQISSSLASILNATTPLFTVLVAHVGTPDEKAGWAKIGGVLIGLAGVAVMVGPDALQGLTVHVWGQLAILGAALSYAAAGVFGRRFARLGVKPTQTACGQLIASSLMLLPLVLLVDRPWSLPVPGITVLSAVIGLAVLSTSLAYVLYFRLLASSGATNLLLVTFLIPISAILLGILVLGETLEVRHLTGMAFIGLGLAAIDGRLLARPGVGK